MASVALPPTAVSHVYDATDNGDGTFTIHDLPIVGPMTKGEKPDSFGEAPGTDREWMERVITNHMGQMVRGFVAPAHAGHNGLMGEPRAVGSFVPLCVREMHYEGKTIPVLCADVTVDQWGLDEIRAGHYPYRSIEVARWSEAVINSLALMSGCGPYWRFPMLREVRVTKAEPAPEDAAVAIPAVPTPTGLVAATAQMRARSFARLAAIAEEQSKEAPPSGEKPQDEEKPDTPAPGAETEQSATAKGLAGVMALLTRIAEAVLGKKTEDRNQPARDEHPAESGDETHSEPDGDEGEDDDETPGKKPAKEKAQMSSTPTTLEAQASQLAALTGRLTALETSNAQLQAANAELSAKLAKSEADARTKTRIDEAKAKLRAARVVLPADFDKTAAQMSAAGDATFDSFVSTLETSGRKDPPATFADEMGVAATNVGDEAEVMAFASRGPAALEAARSQAAAWRAYVQRTPGSAMPLAKWLEINVKAKA